MMLQLLAELQGMAGRGLVIPAGLDREHLLQHVGGPAIGHQRREVSLQPIELWGRPAMRRPVNTALDPATGSRHMRRSGIAETARLPGRTAWRSDAGGNPA